MTPIRFVLRYLWLWVLLLLAGAAVAFTLLGNNPVLPAIYH